MGTAWLVDAPPPPTDHISWGCTLHQQLDGRARWWADSVNDCRPNKPLGIRMGMSG